jgi:hypothetical protein
MFLHIIYHQIVLFLHQFAIPKMPGGRAPKDMPVEFVRTSGHTAISAANTISSIIAESNEHLVVAPFAGYCAFTASTVHVVGAFSKHAALEATSKKNLAHNIKYLGKMKRYWGVFHSIAENLKDLFRIHADAARAGSGAGTKDEPKSDKPSPIIQYGDSSERPNIYPAVRSPDGRRVLRQHAADEE